MPIYSNIREGVMTARVILFAAVVCLFCAPTAGCRKDVSQRHSIVLQEGRELTTLFYARNTADLWRRLSPAMKSALSNEDAFSVLPTQIESQLGTERRIMDEKATKSTYVRTASFSKFDGPVYIQWTIDESGIVTGFFIRPAK